MTARPDSEYGPQQLAMLDQALAESRSDLARLLDTARKLVAERGPDIAADQLIQGLLGQQEWDRLNLSTVLGVALVELARKDPA